MPSAKRSGTDRGLTDRRRYTKIGIYNRQIRITPLHGFPPRVIAKAIPGPQPPPGYLIGPRCTEGSCRCGAAVPSRRRWRSTAENLAARNDPDDLVGDVVASYSGRSVA